jgi:hypothetical protein
MAMEWDKRSDSYHWVAVYFDAEERGTVIDGARKRPYSVKKLIAKQYIGKVYEIMLA